jgi:FKBP-type peptidyl-prolyl cis-trans isomerase FkpA/FKBP-type peptidyl-prolyl cis-trans isomerase FklB
MSAAWRAPGLGVMVAVMVALGAVVATAASSDGAPPPGTDSAQAASAAAPSGAKQNSGATPDAAAKHDAGGPVDPKLLYALGVIMSSGIDNFQLSESEFAQVTAGLADGYRHRADVSQALAYDPQLQVLRRARVQAMTEREKKAGRAYLTAVAASHGATRTASGLVYIPVAEGGGAKPSFYDTVRMNYVGKLVDGSEFDSSAARGEPATIILSDVMPCFTEGLQLMRAGGKGRIVCPPELAYGDRGSSPKVRPGATLEFDVELLEVMPPRTPARSGEQLQAQP